MNKICTEQDEFVYERFDRQARWVATLTDGTIVYQDDGRYAEKDNSWLRLVKHCRENNLKVSNLRIQFRSNTKDFVGYEGYMLTFGAGRDAGNEHTDNYFIVGLLTRETLVKTWWKTPEMTPGRVDYETLEEAFNGEFGEALIK